MRRFVHALRLPLPLLATLGLALFCLAFVGCSLTRDDSPEQGAAVESDQLTAVRFRLRLATPYTSNTTSAAIRAAASTPVQVAIDLTSLAVGGQTLPTTLYSATATANANNDVDLTLTVPARTSVARVRLVNGNIDNFTVFRGAKDLVAGANTMIVHPEGSLMTQDVTANAILRVASDATMLARAPLDIASRTAALVAPMNRTGSATSVYEAALALVTANVLNPAATGTGTGSSTGTGTSTGSPTDLPTTATAKETLRAGLVAIGDWPRGATPSDTTGRRNQALSRLKAYRYLCGVSYNALTLDANFNDLAYWAAEVCRQLGYLTHTPTQPAGMSATDFAKASQGCGSSNLFGGTAGFYSPAASIDAYMDDSDTGNRDRVGHRRWCLHPKMGKTGVGEAGGFMALYAFDTTNSTAGMATGAVAAPGYVAYPRAGFMPTQYFPDSSYVWNVSFNTTIYKKPVAGSVVVRVVPIDAADNATGAALSNDYLNINNDGFGLAACIIWHPSGIDVSAGKRYRVEIDGVQLANGTAAPIRYAVEFFTLAP